MPMPRLHSIFVTSLALLLLRGTKAVPLRAQSRSSQHKLLLQADFKPGEVLRYELEAAGSFLPIADASGANLFPARGPCDYAMAAIVTLRPQPADKDGNTPVEAAYSETRVTSVRCALFSAPDFQKRLAALQSSPVMFRVGPHGETEMSRSIDGYFKYWDGGDLLRKVTQDLLQTEFSPQPVAEGASWKPRGQFAYSHDRALKDLELSGADLRFRNLVQVDGKSCAWVTSQYVFSPIDLPAVGTASGGRTVPGAGNNAVAAVLHISLLLDPATHHVAWLHRSQTIDNKLTLASPLRRRRFARQRSCRPGRRRRPGESHARYVEHAVRQSRPLSLYDVSFPGRSAGAAVARSAFCRVAGGIEALRSNSRSGVWNYTRPGHKNASSESDDSGGEARRGEAKHAAWSWILKRWSQLLPDSPATRRACAATRGSARPFRWPCPETCKFPTTPRYALCTWPTQGDHLVSISVGPALDRRSQGLTDDEELRKQAKYYLDNYVWLAAKPGIGTDFISTTLDGYPGLITDFSATQRDLANIHGVLGLMLTPWGKVVPVSCSWDHASSADLQSLCEKVITSVSLRR